MPTTSKEGQKLGKYGSQWNLKDGESSSPRMATLQNKWRNVWRVSVDRKKTLQDMLDHLLEVSMIPGGALP